MAHCCRSMRTAIRENAVEYIDKFDEYGVHVLDGGMSIIVLRFCPWCAARLPRSKRSQWFGRLFARGIDPDSGEVPKEMQSDAWWREQPRTLKRSHPARRG